MRRCGRVVHPASRIALGTGSVTGLSGRSWVSKVPENWDEAHLPPGWRRIAVSCSDHPVSNSSWADFVAARDLSQRLADVPTPSPCLWCGRGLRLVNRTVWRWAGLYRTVLILAKSRPKRTNWVCRCSVRPAAKLPNDRVWCSNRYGDHRGMYQGTLLHAAIGQHHCS